MVRAAHEETRACDMHSLTSEPTHSRRTVEALWPVLHPIHEVDAVLAGGRATPTTNSCAGNRDKAPRRKCSQFLELISSVAVAGTCRLHARYMNQPCILCGESGRNCQVRLGAHSNCSPAGPLAALRHHAGTIAQSRTGAGRSRHMLQVDLLRHSILGRRRSRSE
jgi:hypothetical protein